MKHGSSFHKWSKKIISLPTEQSNLLMKPGCNRRLIPKVMFMYLVARLLLVFIRKRFLRLRLIYHCLLSEFLFHKPKELISWSFRNQTDVRWFECILWKFVMKSTAGYSREVESFIESANSYSRRQCTSSLRKYKIWIRTRCTLHQGETLRMSNIYQTLLTWMSQT